LTTSQVTAPRPEGAVRLRYIPALDGLRGLSLPGTILTHFALILQFRAGAPDWLHHVGPLTLNIEMFFVLSGALITALLVAEHQRHGAVSLSTFYLRRSRRLGPALLVVLPVMAVLQLAWPGKGAAEPLGNHPWLALTSVAVFCGNWVLFRIAGGIGWLGPAWTLGIEEQFYLSWPAVLRLALRHHARRVAVLLGLGIACVASIAIGAALYAHVGPARTFYATPTQLPSILLGCALGYELMTNHQSLLTKLLRSRLAALFGLVGMVLISIKGAGHTGFLYRGGYVFYAGFACLLIGHCFVVAGEERETIVTRFFGWRPFVVIGQVSYEAYLIHTIVILAMVRALPRMHVYPMIALDTAIVAAVSALFYYLIERPIRRRGWREAFRRTR
jgi:peptidoglycan/LPS O-acetylase OafA/YrhL